MRLWINIYRLGVKELWSLRYDPLLIFLIVYAFTFAPYSAAEDAAVDVRNAAIAIVDEDRSQLSRRIRDAMLPPYFQAPELVAFGEFDEDMERGRYTFALVIPAHLGRDVLAGERPALQLHVDATAMTLAGRGALYIQQIVTREVERFLSENSRRGGRDGPVDVVIRARFNPNLESSWFQGVTEVVSHITVLAIILAGAAVLREREHGTLEHLLVMPLRPREIMLAKVWANGLVILVSAMLSLEFVIRRGVGVPFEGSLSLFAGGAALYLFSITALGIFLATTARSMAQFGLLSIPVFLTMILLSGSYTPLDAMPDGLRLAMQVSPSTHFVSFSKSVLFRGAGAGVVWPDLLGMAVTGAAFFLGALWRFRTSVAAQQ